MNHPVDLLDLGQKRKTPFVAQSESQECGLACLAMVAGAHGYKTDLTTLRRKFGISLKGATLNQMISVSEALGFHARPVRADLEDLHEMALPAILHWRMKHFVVLAEIQRRAGKTRYRILDPSKGPLLIDRDEMSRSWTGVGLELIKASTFRRKTEAPSLEIRQLWSSMSGFWSTTIRIIALSAILQIFALAAPFYLQTAIDTALPSGDKQLLFTLALGFGGLALLEMATSFLRAIVIVNLNNTLLYQITINLFHHMMRLPLDWFEKRHVGDVIGKLGSTQPITQILGNGMVAGIIDGIMALVTLIIMFVYSPMLSAIALLALGFYVFLRMAYFETLRVRNVNAITTLAAEQSSLIEAVRGIATVKSFGQENNRQRLWQKKKADSTNASLQLGRLTAGFDAFAQLITALERVVFVYLSVYLAFDGRITIGMIFAYQAYKQQFLDAGIRLVGQISNYRVIKLHLSRIGDIALSPCEVDGRDEPKERLDIKGAISLRNVSYSYAAHDSIILSEISLQIEPGQMIALVGPSGGGKTTLMKIMMSLHEPMAGQVSIDGMPMARLSKRAYRRAIGSVAQNDVLYAGTLSENISFFDTDIDMDRVIEVAKLANIHDEIEAFPLRYGTLVGDMGSALSGGQRQRILLARALYSKPAILFMDEGTANLDNQCEAQVLATLKSLEITRVVIAHRSSAIEAADQVYLVADCRIRRIK